MVRSRKQPLAELAVNGYWREEDAEVVLIALEESGLSVAAFAREHGLSPGRLLRWRKRLGSRSGFESRSRAGRSQSKESSIGFHRVRVVDSCTAGGSRDGSELELRLGSRRIVVRRGFDPELLKELVRAVEGWAGC